eukprot:1159745-Pelagomonas_calceolata.AAC.1
MRRVTTWGTLQRIGESTEIALRIGLPSSIRPDRPISRSQFGTNNFWQALPASAQLVRVRLGVSKVLQRPLHQGSFKGAAKVPAKAPALRLFQ